MRKRRFKLRRIYVAYLFVFPCALILILMMYNPMVRTVIFTFSKIELPSFDTTYFPCLRFRRSCGIPLCGLLGPWFSALSSDSGPRWR